MSAHIDVDCAGRHLPIARQQGNGRRLRLMHQAAETPVTAHARHRFRAVVPAAAGDDQFATRTGDGEMCNQPDRRLAIPERDPRIQCVAGFFGAKLLQQADEMKQTDFVFA